jgi:membrane fusion protein
LFRREAAEHAANRLTGDVILESVLSFRILAGLVIAIVMALSIFVSTASYARKEAFAGWLVPEGGLIRMQARQGGVLEKLSIREGAKVAAGQRLAVVRLSSASNEGDTGRAFARELKTEAAATQAQASATLDKLAAEQNDLKPKRAFLAGQLAETRQQIGFQEQQVALAQNDLAGMDKLAGEGYVTRRELDSRRAALLSTEQTLSSLRNSLLTIQQQIADIDARLHQIPADIARANADLASARAQIAEKGTQNDAQSAYVVTASVAGRVLAIPVETGQTLAAGATVAVIAPKGAHLEAELYAPSRAIGFVKKGEEVRLMYEAFPYEKFGTARGTVTSVSRTILAPSEVSIPGLAVSQPVFRVRASLASEDIHAYGQAVPLQPGMLVNADVVFDRRTLLQWLLDPLYAAGRR